MFGVIIGFVGVIFMGSIFNFMMISIVEWMCEIVMFRVLGYGFW